MIWQAYGRPEASASLWCPLGETPDVHEATRLLNMVIEGWRTANPKLADWAQDNMPEGSAVFGLPPEHRVRMRTTNGLERIKKALERRTRVASLFPNTASCLRLVSALLAEQDEEWMSAKIYVTMKTCSQQNHNSPKPETGNSQKNSCMASKLAQQRALEA